MKGISRNDVIEVKSLSNPPEAVKTTLTTTFLLLGHFEEETKNYANIRKLVGKAGPQSVSERTTRLDPNTVPLAVALGARSLMKDLSVDKVKNVSMATVAFHTWNEAVVEAVLSRYGEEEISKTQPRTARPVSPQ